MTHPDIGNPDELFVLQERLRAAEHRNKILELKCQHSLANNLCPDHRDKQRDKPCLACGIETLERQNERLKAECEDHRKARQLLATDLRSLSEGAEVVTALAAGVEERIANIQVDNVQLAERVKVLEGQRDVLMAACVHVIGCIVNGDGDMETIVRQAIAQCTEGQAGGEGACQ